MQAQRCMIKDEAEMQVVIPLCAYVKADAQELRDTEENG